MIQGITEGFHKNNGKLLRFLMMRANSPAASAEKRICEQSLLKKVLILELCLLKRFYMNIDTLDELHAKMLNDDGGNLNSVIQTRRSSTGFEIIR